MRFELLLLLIVAGLCFHIYTEGKMWKKLMVYKKYAQMGGILVGACVLYVLVKKNPENAQNIIMGSNEYLKYLPVDKNTSSILSPILDFTKQRTFSQGQGDPQQLGSQNGYGNPVLQVPSGRSQTLLESGKKSSKRSVSETKKKFVASRQSWCCGGCKNQLNAWFEVDHKIRLADGGSNHVDNLIAYCRECHGKKTTMENL